MSLLAPSILAADFAHLGNELAACEEAGADRIHIDIMDNHFVPNLTMGPEVVAACRRSTSLFLEAHLMVEHPDGIIARFTAAGANLITVHYEACPQLHRTVQLIRSEGASPGVGINPATPVDLLLDILPEISLALVMSVEPGFGGQPFLTSALAKMRDLRRLVEERQLNCDIEVDGGVDPDNAAACLAAGATVLVAGTAVFQAEGGAKAGVGCLLDLMGRGRPQGSAEA
ncbi:MAG TPA: ribulose-phosphate 3-epimerase [Candidatus Acidoferrales bacterium]|nr:ribulose-phosphate 3-epimerase [Candidatus Acidoferrales bacterium]